MRRALEARSPTKEVRRLMATEAGFERDGWQKLNQELGLTAAPHPRGLWRRGFRLLPSSAIVLEEMGRGLLCAPFFSTALATTAILNAGTEEQKRHCCRPIADGTTTATLAFAEDEAAAMPRASRTTATPSGGDLAARRRRRASCSTATPPI